MTKPIGQLAKENLVTYKKTFEDLASHDKGHSPQGTSWEEDLLKREKELILVTSEGLQLATKGLGLEMKVSVNTDKLFDFIRSLFLASRTKTLEEIEAWADKEFLCNGPPDEPRCNVNDQCDGCYNLSTLKSKLDELKKGV